MSSHTRYLATAFAIAAATGALALAPGAAARPECVNTGPTTTLCQTPGHAQIITSPPVMNNGPWGYPYGGFNIGGFGIGLGW